MGRIVRWSELIAEVAPLHPNVSEAGGRPPIPLERTLRVYFLLLWFDLPGPATAKRIRAMDRPNALRSHVLEVLLAPAMWAPPPGHRTGMNLVGNQAAHDISKQKLAFLKRETDFLVLDIRRRPSNRANFRCLRFAVVGGQFELQGPSHGSIPALRHRPRLAARPPLLCRSL